MLPRLCGSNFIRSLAFSSKILHDLGINAWVEILGRFYDMPREITPIAIGDIPEVASFLAHGFGMASDSIFARPEFLRWKFFDPRDGSQGPRGYVSREDGRIIGFVGICPGTFHVASDAAREVPTLHMVDWLAEKSQSNAGAYLFLRVHRGVDTAYTLGASEDARRVVAGAGYEELQNMPVFVKTLRPQYRLQNPGGIGGVARALNDLALLALRPGTPPVASVKLRKVETFGDEIDVILNVCEPGVVFTRRRPDLLNHLLRCPSQTISGYLIERDGQTLGFALLSVIPSGKTRIGKIVECFLPGRNIDDWHAAMTALTSELKVQRADFAMSCGSTDWSAEALRRSGYRERYRLEFRLRDKGNHLPHDLPFHLTWIEADYSYLP